MKQRGNKRNVAANERAVEQINGREAETATFIKRNFLSFGLSLPGFRPRHLKR